MAFKTLPIPPGMARQMRSWTFRWRPRNRSEARIADAARAEAARMWHAMLVRHCLIRRGNPQDCAAPRNPQDSPQRRPGPRPKWPSYQDWCDWSGGAQGQFPGLCSASRQGLIADFLEALKAVRHLKQNGHGEARWPEPRRRPPRYRDVSYTYAAATIREGWLRLPNGTSGVLTIRLPQGGKLPGDRFQQATLGQERVTVVCSSLVPASQEPTVWVGIDTGVNAFAACTDGETNLVVSGRHLKAVVQYRNARLSTLQEAQSQRTKGSRRWKRLEARKRTLLAQSDRKVDDLVHKASRLIANTYGPETGVVIGEAWNAGAQGKRARQAQQISQTPTGKLRQQVAYKLNGAAVVDESYTSRLCPRCGAENERVPHGREYTCGACGYTHHIDLTAALTILRRGLPEGTVQAGAGLPEARGHMRLWEQGRRPGVPG